MFLFLLISYTIAAANLVFCDETIKQSCDSFSSYLKVDPQQTHFQAMTTKSSRDYQIFDQPIDTVIFLVSEKTLILKSDMNCDVKKIVIKNIEKTQCFVKIYFPLLRADEWILDNCEGQIISPKQAKFFKNDSGNNEKLEPKVLAIDSSYDIDLSVDKYIKFSNTGYNIDGNDVAVGESVVLKIKNSIGKLIFECPSSTTLPIDLSLELTNSIDNEEEIENITISVVGNWESISKTTTINIKSNIHVIYSEISKNVKVIVKNMNSTLVGQYPSTSTRNKLVICYNNEECTLNKIEIKEDEIYLTTKTEEESQQILKDLSIEYEYVKLMFLGYEEILDVNSIASEYIGELQLYGISSSKSRVNISGNTENIKKLYISGVKINIPEDGKTYNFQDVFVKSGSAIFLESQKSRIHIKIARLPIKEYSAPFRNIDIDLLIAVLQLSFKNGDIEMKISNDVYTFRNSVDGFFATLSLPTNYKPDQLIYFLIDSLPNPNNNKIQIISRNAALGANFLVTNCIDPIPFEFYGWKSETDFDPELKEQYSKLMFNFMTKNKNDVSVGYDDELVVNYKCFNEDKTYLFSEEPIVENKFIICLTNSNDICYTSEYGGGDVLPILITDLTTVEETIKNIPTAINMFAVLLDNDLSINLSPCLTSETLEQLIFSNVKSNAITISLKGMPTQDNTVWEIRGCNINAPNIDKEEDKYLIKELILINENSEIIGGIKYNKLTYKTELDLTTEKRITFSDTGFLYQGKEIPSVETTIVFDIKKSEGKTLIFECPSSTTTPNNLNIEIISTSLMNQEEGRGGEEEGIKNITISVVGNWESISKTTTINITGKFNYIYKELLENVILIINNEIHQNTTTPDETVIPSINPVTPSINPVTPSINPVTPSPSDDEKEETIMSDSHNFEMSNNGVIVDNGKIEILRDTIISFTEDIITVTGSTKLKPKIYFTPSGPGKKIIIDTSSEEILIGIKSDNSPLIEASDSNIPLNLVNDINSGSMTISLSSNIIKSAITLKEAEVRVGDLRLNVPNTINSVFFSFVSMSSSSSFGVHHSIDSMKLILSSNADKSKMKENDNVRIKINEIKVKENSKTRMQNVDLNGKLVILNNSQISFEGKTTFDAKSNIEFNIVKDAIKPFIQFDNQEVFDSRISKITLHSTVVGENTVPLVCGQKFESCKSWASLISEGEAECSKTDDKSGSEQTCLNAILNKSSGNKKLDGGKIAGIVIGVLAFVAIVVGIIIFFMKRKGSIKFGQNEEIYDYKHDIEDIDEGSSLA